MTEPTEYWKRSRHLLAMGPIDAPVPDRRTSDCAPLYAYQRAFIRKLTDYDKLVAIEDVESKATWYWVMSRRDPRRIKRSARLRAQADSMLLARREAFLRKTGEGRPLSATDPRFGTHEPSEAVRRRTSGSSGR